MDLLQIYCLDFLKLLPMLRVCFVCMCVGVRWSVILAYSHWKLYVHGIM